jgi:uncharacterized membrane protein
MCRVLLLAILLAFSAGCGDNHDDGHSHDPTKGVTTQSVCPTPQTLTYENFGRMFMASYCLRCHSEAVTGATRTGAPADHNFDNVNMIRSLAGHIDQYAAAGPAGTNAVMPPADPRPSADERRKLGEWLACMAP